MNKHKYAETILGGNYLFRNTGITSICQGLGVICGVALDAIILATFGLGGQTDALFAAWALPKVLGGLMEIQGPKMLVPIFMKSSEEDSEKRWRLVCNFLYTSSVLLCGVALFGMAVAGILIPMQVPGLRPDLVRLSVQLNMVLFWLVPLSGISTICRSLLYAQHRYLVASSLKFVTNIVAIAFVILFAGQIGIFALAIGFLLGSIMHMVLMLWSISSHGLSHRFVCDFRDPELHQLLKSLPYPLAGEGQFDVAVANISARALGERAPFILPALTSEGCLVASGIMNNQRQEVHDALTQLGFSLTKEWPRDEWITLAYRAPAA